MLPARIIPMFLILASLGCAERRPLQLEKSNIASITYRNRLCHEQPNKTVVCDGVIFTMKTVGVQDLRK
jgi:hypothetical protein